MFGFKDFELHYTIKWWQGYKNKEKYLKQNIFVLGLKIVLKYTSEYGGGQEKINFPFQFAKYCVNISSRGKLDVLNHNIVRTKP